MDGFFDMPAGYNDADMEMAELEAAGNRHARRVRKWGAHDYGRLQAGETIERACTHKPTGTAYSVLMRLTDDCPDYSADGGTTWHNSAREAYEAEQAIS